MKSIVILFALTMVLINSTSLAFGQSFLCSPMTGANVFPKSNGTRGAKAVNSFEPYESFILRPPTKEDLSILKKSAYLKGDYPFVIRIVGLPLIMNACKNGFNSSGYISCDEGVSELLFSFTSKRYRLISHGDFLSGGNEYAEAFRIGTCISN